MTLTRSTVERWLVAPIGRDDRIALCRSWLKLADRLLLCSIDHTWECVLVKAARAKTYGIVCDCGYSEIQRAIAGEG